VMACSSLTVTRVCPSGENAARLAKTLRACDEITPVRVRDSTVRAISVLVESLARRYEALRPHLTERQRRLWLGAEARELGSGGAVVGARVLGGPRTRCAEVVRSSTIPRQRR
jgi:hypothetical protein